MRITTLVLSLASAFAVFAADNQSTEMYRAIRGNDLTRLKSLIAHNENVNLKDQHGTTPLMYTAAVGSVDAMKMLLAAGADAKVANAFGATPLMWGVVNREKVRMLLEAGADVNARSKQTMTPLLIAASNAGSIDIVRLLVSKGADVMAKSDFDTTTLQAAANANDLEIARFFVEKGVSVNAADKRGNTPLQFAAGNINLPLVKLLLAHGADVNAANQGGKIVKKGPLALKSLTPLMLAAPHASPELIKTLIDAGAKVNVSDVRGMTPLMFAVASEIQDPLVVRLLLEKGADPKAKSIVDETALDWAMKFGNPDVLKLLGGTRAQAELRGLSDAADARLAVARSVALLQNSTTQFFKESGCVGCHHHNLTSMLVGAARKTGVKVDDAAATEQGKQMKGRWRGEREILLQRLDPPGGSDTLFYSLLGWAATDYPADDITDAMVANLAWEQTPEGSWCYLGNARSPLEEGCIARAAMALHALQAYGPPGLKAEFDQRIARARAYLLAAKPKTTDDLAMRLLGLHWSGAESEKVHAAARELLSAQRADGGWGGNQYLASEAYSTGEALQALHESGTSKASDPAYRGGVRFLLGTQQSDGSWHVKSRAVKFQPYFQSGFPNDHDQWISAAGTGWAAMALANSIN